MKLSEWAESFQIFAKYGDLDFAVSTEHDAIHTGLDEVNMSEEDCARLKKRGWLREHGGELLHFT